MLRIVTSRSTNEAKSYYTDGLSRQDYYAEKQEIAGNWAGRGAEMLGLAGTVTQATFAALADNRHPWSGHPLTARTKSNRIVGYDFNFHCPKSVSVVHALTGDERIVTAMSMAVDATFAEIEKLAQTRVRKAGANSERTTGNLVRADFIHFTARPVEGVPDPHLHRHCYVFNATYDEVEGKWKAGHFQEILRNSPYFEAVFHSHLALGLERLGYRTERRGKFFELAGVPRELTEKFSNRTATIEELAKELGIEDNATAKSKLGALTRARKLKDLSTTDLKAKWLERLTPEERQLLTSLRENAHNLDREFTPPPPMPADYPGGRLAWARHGWEEAAIRHAAAHGFERQSVLDERRFMEIALRYGVGRVELSALWRTLQNRSDLIIKAVHGRRLVTTPAVVEEERTMVLWVRNGLEQAKPLAPGHLIVNPLLNAEQRRAVEHVLGSRDRVTGIEGRAGTGKTTVMKEALAALSSHGHSVLVLTPTAKMAREVFPKDGIKDAETVARLLVDTELQRQYRGGVWWIDEAGMISSRMMVALCLAAERNDARLIFSGDTRQHGSVERGDALRILRDQAGLKLALVETIQRQKGLYKEAVLDCSRGQIAEGLEKFDRMGAIREVDTAERYKELAREYLEARREGASAVVISPTHSEGRRVTDIIRNDLKASGELTRERLIPRLRNLDMTQAQRADSEEYKPGMVIEFTRPAKGFKQGERLKVMDLLPKDKQSLIVEKPDGTRRQLDLGKYAERFQVYEKTELPVCQGELICVTKTGKTSDRRYKVSNGVIAKVIGFTQDGDLKLEGGKVLAADFSHLAHGYVATSHASQGSTVDRVFLAQGSESIGAASVEQFYTSVARGKHLLRIYTDDRVELLAGASRSSQRMSALQMLQEAEANRTSEQVPTGRGLESSTPEAETLGLRDQLGQGQRVPAGLDELLAQLEVRGKQAQLEPQRPTKEAERTGERQEPVPELLP